MAFGLLDWRLEKSGKQHPDSTHREGLCTQVVYILWPPKTYIETIFRPKHIPYEYIHGPEALNGIKLSVPEP